MAPTSSSASSGATRTLAVLAHDDVLELPFVEQRLHQIGTVEPLPLHPQHSLVDERMFRAVVRVVPDDHDLIGVELERGRAALRVERGANP
jgi:hypothetical protein